MIKLCEDVVSLATDLARDDVAERLLIDIVEQFGSVPSAAALWRESLGALMVNTRGKVSESYQIQFLDVLYGEVTEGMIASSDVYAALAWVGGEALTARNARITSRIVTVGSRLGLPSSGSAVLPALVLRYYLFVHHWREGNDQSADQYAHELLSALGPDEDVPTEAPAVGNAGTRQTMRSAIKRYLDERAYRQPIVNQYKGIGRNQRVRVRYADDGNIVERKFKQVERDIAVGKCELVEDLAS